MSVKKIHYISGLVIAIFVGLHLLNHFVSVFGVENHIELMNTLRLGYRNLLIESILLIAVFIQIISGVKQAISKRKLANTFFEKLQIWTGLYLAFFFVFHIGAVMMGRFYMQLDTNIYFGVAGLNTYPFYLFFVPYYGLAILSFFGHIAAIHSHKMEKEIIGMSVEQQSRGILFVGFIITLIIFYGLTNGLTGVELPKAYHIMIGK